MSIKKVNSEKSMETQGIVFIELSKIAVSGFNPRRTISESELQELANSIRQVGVLQPVLVRPKGRKFEIVCGERRFRASALAGQEAIPPRHCPPFVGRRGDGDSHNGKPAARKCVPD
jgi:hypothetical protein